MSISGSGQDVGGQPEGSALLWVRAAYRASMEKHGGSIVNVSSVGGLRPSPITGAYNVSKAGLVHA